MNQYKTSAMLKSLARGQLTGYYGKLIPILFLHFTSIIFLEGMIGSLFSADALWADVAYFIGMFVISVFSGLYVAAEHFIYLKVCCHYKVSVSDIFFGFIATPDRFLKIQIILTALNYICMLPYYASLRILKDSDSRVLVTSLLLLAGTVVYMFIEFKYALVFYLAIDFPKQTVRKLYSLSNEIMHGHKLKLFGINLSFFPLILLCFCSCGLGFLWVVPYMYATEANFYLDLMAQRNHNLNNTTE